MMGLQIKKLVFANQPTEISYKHDVFWRQDACLTYAKPLDTAVSSMSHMIINTTAKPDGGFTYKIISHVYKILCFYALEINILHETDDLPLGLRIVSLNRLIKDGMFGDKYMIFNLN